MSTQYIDEENSTTIDLQNVLSWQDSLRDETRPDDELSLVIEMRDGTEVLLLGAAASESFRQTMDHYLGADLF